MLQFLADKGGHAATGTVTAQGYIPFVGNVLGLQKGKRLPGHG